MNKGFTLAEVLITLGIIGVVAAITIPTIISNTQDKQNIVHWRKMYSVINQAFLQTIEEGYSPCIPFVNGETCTNLIESAPHNLNTEFINKMLEKFNVVETCDSGECYNGKTVWAPDYYRRYKTLAGGKINSYNLSSYRARLATGELIMFGGSHGRHWITVDVDGFGNGKDTLGKDVFVMKIHDKYLKPMGADGTFNKNKNGKICECSKNKGAVNENYIGGAGGSSEVASGACCSAYYLLNDK